jgi:hypothetical protein
VVAGCLHVGRILVGEELFGVDEKTQTGFLKHPKTGVPAAELGGLVMRKRKKLQCSCG